MRQSSQHAQRNGGARAASSSSVNVHRAERWASIAGGALLAYAGTKRGWTGKLLLGTAGGALLYRGATGHCPAYEQAGISTAEPQEGSHVGQGADGRAKAVEVDEAVTVARPREEVYRFWRELENLPRFMRHIESVEALGEKRSRWTARVPKGLGTITWEAEITEDVPGETLAWRSLPGADIENHGTVRFDDGPEGWGAEGRGTEVHVRISYRPPAGEVGHLVAKLLNPANKQMVKEDVRRFKHVLETGEVPTIEGQPTGRGRA